MKRLLIVLCLTFTYAANAQHQLPPLPYSHDALAPVMSEETLMYHHGKHVQTYVDNLNKLIPGTPHEDSSLEQIVFTAEGSIFNNGAQILNHMIFFNGLAPEAQAQHRPSGQLAIAIDRDFGSFDNFVTEFSKAASDQFGSGWVWLALDEKGGLKIVSMGNAGNPLRNGLVPIMGIDVWEHSYYIDYRNSRADYLKNIWRIVDWRTIGNRYDNRAYL